MIKIKVSKMISVVKSARYQYVVQVNNKPFYRFDDEKTAMEFAHNMAIKNDRKLTK